MTPTPTATAPKRSPLVIIGIATAGLTAFCCLGSVALVAVGALGDDTPSKGGTAPEGESAGGFSFTAPAGFKPDGPGRVKSEQADGSATLTVEALQLAPVAGRNDAEAKLSKLWNEVIARDWDGVKPNPVVMRRFVSNGARAVFTGAQLRGKNGAIAYVTLMLVDADDALVPMVFIQTRFEPTDKGSIADMMASSSWSTSWPTVEKAISGIKGSPVGLPLLSDDEVVGKWSYGSGSQLQWVSVFSGRTGMDVVSYSIDYELTDDHQYKYKFQSASGTVGALNFGSEKAEGEWSINHDVMTLTSGSGKKTEYLLLGAPVSPDGKRLLHMLPKPNWDLNPGAALANGELYTPKD